MYKNIIDSSDNYIEYKIASSPAETASSSFQEYQKAAFYIPTFSNPCSA